MFWKKKVKEESEARYECKGVNYLKVIEVDGENLDSIKEDLFAAIKSQNKVYTRSDINLITEKLGYDIWDSFIWIDINKSGQEKTSISIRYRWLGLKDDAEYSLSINPNDVMKNVINFQNFYTMVDIQNAAMEVGFDVFDRSEWQIYTCIKHEFLNGDSFEYYQRKN